MAEEDRAVRVDAEANDKVLFRDGAAEEVHERGAMVELVVALVLFSDAAALVETGRLIPVEQIPVENTLDEVGATTPDVEFVNSAPVDLENERAVANDEALSKLELGTLAEAAIPEGETPLEKIPVGRAPVGMIPDE